VKHYQVIILPAAERDIGEAYEWLEERDADAAVRWYNLLIGVILSLDIFPERCPLARKAISSMWKSVRYSTVAGQHKYRILFTVCKNEVHVLHVRHGARLALGEIIS